MVAQLTFAFIAGTVATANPCGFGLLPGYLARLIGEDAGPGRARSDAVARALAVGFLTTAGFLLVFTAVGAAISLGARWVISAMPWAGLTVGAALIVVGLLSFGGIHVGLPARLRGPTPAAGRRGTLLFGVAYGACSLACTLPIFLAVVGTSLLGSGAGAVLAFVFYALGMGSILTALAVALALARGGLARTIRRLLPYASRAGGALLALVGVYVVYYWVFALANARTGTGWSQPLDLVSRFSSAVENWLAGPTGRSVSIWMLAALAALAAWTAWWRFSERFTRAPGRPDRPGARDGPRTVPTADRLETSNRRSQS